MIGGLRQQVRLELDLVGDSLFLLELDCVAPIEVS